MPALIYDPDRAEIVALPETPYTENVRRARVDLEVDAQAAASPAGEA